MNTPTHTTQLPDDQGNQPTPEEPPSTTISIKTKKQKAKSKLPTKHTKKPKRVSQEAEVPERPVVTPIQQTHTTVETSSQQIVSPPPSPTPQQSSLQDVVVSPRDTTQQAEPSFDAQTYIHSPTDSPASPPSHPLSPIINTLLSLATPSGPHTGSPIPTSMEMLQQTSATQDPMLTTGDEDDIPVTSPAGDWNQTADAAITQTSSTEQFDDYSYIFKTSAVAMTDDVVLCTAEVRSPQYREQGAHDTTVQDTGHDVSGLTRDSDDSIKLDDESKLLIKELTAKLSTFESEVSNLKEMVTNMAQEKAHNTPIPPMMASSLEDLNQHTSTTQQPPATSASQPDIPSFLSTITTLLQTHQHQIQQNISHQHKLQFHYLHAYMDTRYLELTRLVKETHHHLTKATGITPPTPWFPSADDEAKKGEKAAFMGQAQKAQAALEDKTAKRKKKALNKLAKDVAANRERAELQHAQGGSSSGQPPSDLPPLPSFPELIAQAVAAGHLPADFITTDEVSADVQTIIAQTTAEPPPQAQTAKSVVITTTDNLTSAVVQTSKPAVASSVVTVPETVQTTDADDDNTPIKKLVRKKRKLVVTDEEEEQSTQPSQPPASPPVQIPDTTTQPSEEVALENLTEEEMAILQRKAIEDSVRIYLQEQGYSEEVIKEKLKEETERMIKEFEDTESLSISKPKPKPKSKAKSFLQEEERKRMIEELIINDFGARNSVSRWQDKRLSEEYKGLLEWKKKFPQQFKPYNPQALTVKSSRTSLSKPKSSSTSQSTKTYTIMIPSTNQPSSQPASENLAIQQHMTRNFDVHTELDEDEKILITEPYHPKDVGVMESTYTRGSSRPTRKILQLPTTTKQPKSSVTITEINPSTASTASLKPPPSPKSQSKQITKSSDQRQSRIVKWTVDKKTNWMMLTREDGLTSIYKNWYDLLGLSEFDHKNLINLNIEGEDSMSKAKEFELEFKGQIWQKFFGRK